VSCFLGAHTVSCNWLTFRMFPASFIEKAFFRPFVFKMFPASYVLSGSGHEVAIRFGGGEASIASRKCLDNYSAVAPASCRQMPPRWWRYIVPPIAGHYTKKTGHHQVLLAPRAGQRRQGSRQEFRRRTVPPAHGTAGPASILYDHSLFSCSCQDKVLTVAPTTHGCR
jgi:hypothetical protein